jgi:hypothetical protein
MHGVDTLYAAGGLPDRTASEVSWQHRKKIRATRMVRIQHGVTQMKQALFAGIAALSLLASCTAEVPQMPFAHDNDIVVFPPGTYHNFGAPVCGQYCMQDQQRNVAHSHRTS